MRLGLGLGLGLPSQSEFPETLIVGKSRKVRDAVVVEVEGL